MKYVSYPKAVEIQLEQVTKERNEMQWRITQLEIALGPLANLADEIIERKSLEWAESNDALPIHMLWREQGRFTIPTIIHCLRAKRLAEGEDE